MEKYPVASRLAAHYLFLNGVVYRMHYLEFDAGNCCRGAQPLREELAGTVFYNGIVWVVPEENGPEFIGNRLETWKKLYPGNVLKYCLDAEAALCAPGPDSPAAIAGQNGSVCGAVPERPVALYWQRTIGFPPAEFRTDDSCSHSYIQRLGCGMSFRIRGDE